MVGIVVVAHSGKVAEGLAEFAGQLARPGQKILAAGGLADGAVGTDAVRIGEAIAAADSGDGVVVLVDLGSALLSTETALELLGDELRPRVRIADAPLVEGCVSAAVKASLGDPLAEVVAAAEEARDYRKLL